MAKFTVSKTRAGTKQPLTMSERVKEAMRRPDVQAKLHAPRKKRFEVKVQDALRSLLLDPNFCNEVRGRLFADGRFLGVQGLGEKEEPKDPPAWTKLDPALSRVTEDYAREAGQPSGSSPQKRFYWWYRRNENKLFWVEDSPMFETPEEASQWERENHRQDEWYLAGPMPTRYSVIDVSKSMSFQKPVTFKYGRKK